VTSPTADGPACFDGDVSGDSGDNACCDGENTDGENTEGEGEGEGDATSSPRVAGALVMPAGGVPDGCVASDSHLARGEATALFTGDVGFGATGGGCSLAPFLGGGGGLHVYQSRRVTA
jgi:hypothetical protein